MFKWMKPIIGRVRSLSSNLPERKGPSNSSTNPTLIRSGDQLDQCPLQNPGPQLGLSEGSLLNLVDSKPNKPKHLYWCSFISHDNSFIGVVICKGTSPGAAANWAITTGLVEAERANIEMIPSHLEATYLPFANRLLSEGEVRGNFKGLVEKFSALS